MLYASVTTELAHVPVRPVTNPTIADADRAAERRWNDWSVCETLSTVSEVTSWTSVVVLFILVAAAHCPRSSPVEWSLLHYITLNVHRECCSSAILLQCLLLVGMRIYIYNDASINELSVNRRFDQSASLSRYCISTAVKILAPCPEKSRTKMCKQVPSYPHPYENIGTRHWQLSPTLCLVIILHIRTLVYFVLHPKVGLLQ